MLVFRKKNDIYLEVIEGDRGEERMLSDFFTFLAPGYQFHPQFKRKLWDGKIRLFDYYKKRMYIGLLDKLLKWCDNNGYDYSVDIYDKIYTCPYQSYSLAKAYIF